jgi:hypothetical protein
MLALLQRLKELDNKTFEQFCFHLLNEQYPGIDIQPVHGAGGDEGVDLFSGQLEGVCVVWQCKAFPNGVGKSQKAQIRKSLRAALKSVKPKQWILCLSVDFDIKTYRWWAHLQDSYKGEVKIDLVPASELVHQLIYRHTLRELFFPQAIMDVVGIRTALANSKHISAEELATLTAENVAVFLDRLTERGPRFAYDVTFHANTGPVAASARAGSLMTVQDDHKTISVFPRDVDSLRLNPPSVNITLEGHGVTKFREHLDTGHPLEFAPGELTSFLSDFDFLRPSDAAPVTEWKLSVKQAPESLKQYMFRLTFGDGDDAVTYDLVKFQTVAAGQKQVELRNTTKLPFSMRIVLNLANKCAGHMHLAECLPGCSAKEIERGAKALALMSKTGILDIYDLELGKRFLQVHPEDARPPWLPELSEIAKAMVAVESFYGVALVWPASVAPLDLINLDRLNQLISGISVTFSDICINIVKTVQLPAALVPNAVNNGQFALDYPSQGSVSVFGIDIAIGALRVTTMSGRVRDKAAYEEFLYRAPIGWSIDLALESPFDGLMFAVRR